MDINAFQQIVLPSKAQIFARTGRKAVKRTDYTGDDSANFGALPTQTLEQVARTAEKYEPKQPESDE